MDTNRSLESSFRVVTLAKLDPESLMPKSQAIRFAPNQSDGAAEGEFQAAKKEQEMLKNSIISDQLILLEVTPEVANEMENGDKFVFRGEANDWVSLCSDKAVYDIKEAETSNSLLLVKDILQSGSCQERNSESDDDAHNVTVLKTFYRYLEMKPAKPGFQKLYTLLESRMMKSYRYTLPSFVIFTLIFDTLIVMILHRLHGH